MTLPKKGSRTIEIAGVRYRWMVSRREGILHIAAQHESGAGALRMEAGRDRRALRDRELARRENR